MVLLLSLMTRPLPWQNTGTQFGRRTANGGSPAVISNSSLHACHELRDSTSSSGRPSEHDHCSPNRRHQRNDASSGQQSATKPQENQSWFGRVSAAIEKWDPSKSPLMRERLDLFFSNGHARETAHGLNKLLMLLDQAQAELRLEIIEMSDAAETPSQRRAWALLKAIYDRTHLDARPIDDVTKLDVGLTEEEARAASIYLKDKGLLRTYAIPDAASINAAGIDAIENHQVDEKLTPPSVGVAASTLGGKKVFIGHGRSLLWLKLRWFLAETLHLECCEFGDESPAGIATTARLQSMLRDSNSAFLLMTSEDTHADGTAHARENVGHAARLFQGRLGLRPSNNSFGEGLCRVLFKHPRSRTNTVSGRRQH